MPTHGTIFIIFNAVTMNSEPFLQCRNAFSDILAAAVGLQTGDAVDNIGRRAVDGRVDVHGEVALGGGDCLSCLDVGAVDTLATPLHTRQHSLLSRDGRWNLRTDHRLSDILLSSVGYERRGGEYCSHDRVLCHDTPVLSDDLVCGW